MLSASMFASACAGGVVAAALLLSGTNNGGSAASSLEATSPAVVAGCGTCTPSATNFPNSNTGDSCTGDSVTIRIGHGLNATGFGRCTVDCLPGGPCSFPFRVHYTSPNCNVNIRGSDGTCNTYSYGPVGFSMTSMDTLAVDDTYDLSCGGSCTLTFSAKCTSAFCSNPVSIAVSLDFACASCMN